MQSHPAEADLRSITTLLLQREIEFILVGGAAAIVHGSPTGTNDCDIVHARSPENVARLLALIAELDGYFRTDRRRLVPTASHLAGKGQLLLSTRLGPLDLLGTLHDGRGYDELIENTTDFAVDDRTLRVLDLPTLIQVKTAAGRPKDLVVVAELVAMLKEDK